MRSDRANTRSRSSRRRPGWGALTGLLTLAVALGCASPLDKAREAWAEGEGDFTAAEPFYKEAIAKDNSESEFAREELFEAYMSVAAANKKEHPKEAEVYYRGAMELYPNNAEARTGLIRLLMTLYRYEEAFELANEGATTGKCPGCKRLLAVMLIESGDQRSEMEDWPSAEAAYAAAMDLLPDASVALGLTRARVAQNKAEAAAESLKLAADMIDQEDLVGRKRFLELRKAVVMAALEANLAAVADGALDVAPKGVQASAQLDLGIEVAMKLTQDGKADAALSRMQAYAQMAEAGKLRISPEKQAELFIRVALLYGARANQRLFEGDVAAANSDLEEALKLLPGEPTIILQKAVVLGSQGETDGAHKVMAELPRSTPGFRTVDSILFAMEVDAKLAEGKLGAAEDLVRRGLVADPTTPEIQLAQAQVLGLTPFDDMLKSEQKDLRKLGLVEYPKGKTKPLRTGEALAYLALAKKSWEEQDKLAPFRDPGMETRLKATEDKLREFYKYPVEPVADEKGILAVKNPGTTDLSVMVEKRKLYRKKRKIKAGETGTFELSNPGLVLITYGDDDKTAMFLVEPHAQIEITLP